MVMYSEVILLANGSPMQNGKEMIVGLHFYFLTHYRRYTRIFGWTMPSTVDKIMGRHLDRVISKLAQISKVEAVF